MRRSLEVAMELIVRSGLDAGASATVEGRLTVGREGEFRLTDPSVSRMHAALTRTQDGRAVLEDLGSSGGTMVNGSRISGPVFLVGGDRAAHARCDEAPAANGGGKDQVSASVNPGGENTVANLKGAPRRLHRGSVDLDGDIDVGRRAGGVRARPLRGHARRQADRRERSAADTPRRWGRARPGLRVIGHRSR